MYFLSFDCATKSLAFVIAYVDVENISLDIINQNINNQDINKQDINKLIKIIDGETVDLFPNIADVDILTVDRIKALVIYVRKRILPILAGLGRQPLILTNNDTILAGQDQHQDRQLLQAIAGQDQQLQAIADQDRQLQATTDQLQAVAGQDRQLQVLIEFQMGANPKARMIFAALIAIFADYDVELVNPSLKNKIYFSEEGKHKHFIKKYSQLYSANKAHAKYNFEFIEKKIGSPIKATSTEKGHIADAFMQILGQKCRSWPAGLGRQPLSNIIK